MTTKLLIPAKAITENKCPTLDLGYPARCSRCNAQPAAFLETHPLRYKADLVPNRTIDRKFRTNISFKLRLPLCETCYQVNFIENPDSVVHDQTPLGQFSRARSIGIKVASSVAGIAFILLMKIMPLQSVIAASPNLWLYFIAAALVLFAITFGSTFLKNQSIKSSLTSSDFKVKLHRAVAYETIQIETAQPDDPAVFVTLENDQWAKECAEKNGWELELTHSTLEKDESK